MNKNKQKSVQEPNDVDIWLLKHCVHCGEPKDECTGYKCWIR